MRTISFARCTAMILGVMVWSLPGSVRAENSGAVVYHRISEGEEVEGAAKRVLIQQDGLSRLYEVPTGTPIAMAPQELSYFDFGARRTIQTAKLPDGSRCTVMTALDSLPPLAMTDERETILGHECIKATTEIRSNKIEVWLIRDVGITGSPTTSVAAEGGLILKLVQNGSSGLLAERIETDPQAVAQLLSEQPQPFRPADWGEEVDSAEYRARITDSYVTTITVFDEVQLSFGNEIHNPAESDSGAVFHYSKGTVAVRRVTLPEVDDETMILAELVEVSNGDAYDRTGSIFLIPTDRTHTYLDGLRDGVEALPALDLQNGAYQGIAATEDYLPPLELIRFITPFGVGAFNSRSKVRGLEWADEARYVMDVTDLAGSLQGSVWIGAFIGNYDKGGHKVTLRLRYFPGEQVESETPPARRFTLPLFNTVNAMEMSGQNYGTLFGSDSLSAEFDLPNGIEDLQLRYITTGHGGWGGGDEFNPKVNTILLDGQVASSFVPWRSDCGTFRENNPSSGNFWNGISSSDFSRSGWCPGTTVSPYVVPLAGLVPGRHRIQVAIPLGEREGSAFSSWNVSGVLVGRFADPEQP